MLAHSHAALPSASFLSLCVLFSCSSRVTIGGEPSDAAPDSSQHAQTPAPWFSANETGGAAGSNETGGTSRPQTDGLVETTDNGSLGDQTAPRDGGGSGKRSDAGLSPAPNSGPDASSGVVEEDYDAHGSDGRYDWDARTPRREAGNPDPLPKGTPGAHVWFDSSVRVQYRYELSRTLWGGDGGIRERYEESCGILERPLTDAQEAALKTIVLVPINSACSADGFDVRELTVFDADGSEAVYRDTGCSYLRVVGAKAMLPLGFSLPSDGWKACPQ